MYYITHVVNVPGLKHAFYLINTVCGCPRREDWDTNLDQRGQEGVGDENGNEGDKVGEDDEEEGGYVRAVHQARVDHAVDPVHLLSEHRDLIQKTC